MKVCKECSRIKAGTEKWYTPFWRIWFGHNTKVSELEELFEIDDNDYLMISDMSKNESKKIKMSDLVEYIKTRIK